MMKQYLVMTLLLASIHVKAQQRGGKTPDAPERYISYANTEANKILFDPEEYLGLYPILLQTINGSPGSDTLTLKGIAPDQLASLKADSSMKVRYYLSKQKIVPLKSSFGEDSVVYPPDGAAMYVYPPRDTIWYSVTGFDELVFREQLWMHPSTKEKTYVPVELFLRRKDPVSGEPVILLGMDVRALYEGEKILAYPVGLDNNSLCLNLGEYLDAGQKRFGGDGFYQLHGNDEKAGERESILFPGKEMKQYTTAEILNSPLVQPGELGFRLIYDTLFSYNGQGELVYEKDPNDSRNLLAFDVKTDTLWYVKKGFEKMYAICRVNYQPLDDSYGYWQFNMTEVWATKKLLPGELPQVVHISTMRSEPLTIFDEVPAQVFLKDQYELSREPVSWYYKRSTMEGTMPLYWQIKLLDHKLVHELVAAPVR